MHFTPNKLTGVLKKLLISIAAGCILTSLSLLHVAEFTQQNVPACATEGTPLESCSFATPPEYYRGWPRPILRTYFPVSVAGLVADIGIFSVASFGGIVIVQRVRSHKR